MTQIDFYVMTGGRLEDAILIACRLIEKAMKTGTVYIHCHDKLQAATLHEKLWSFRPEAFIPHELMAEIESPTPSSVSKDMNETVVIGYQEAPESFHNILINLSLETPAVFARFERLLEIVPAEHEARNACRQKYRYYKDRGYPLSKHDINP